MREQFSCQFNKYGCAKVVILQGHHVNLFRATIFIDSSCLDMCDVTYSMSN